MSKTRIDFDSIDAKSQAKLIKGSIIPRPIAWISTLNEDGSINLAPFSFFNVVSGNVLSVSFQHSENNIKDTYRNIMREKEAVIHIVDKLLIEAMDKTAKVLPRNESELDLTNLSLSKSLKIKTPGLQEALIRFEVVLEDSISIKNKTSNALEADLVLLRVLASVVDDKVYDPSTGYILANELNPVACLGGQDYSLIKESSFKRRY